VNMNAILFVCGMTTTAAGFTQSSSHVLVTTGLALLLCALSGMRNIPLNLYLALFAGMVAAIVHGSLQPGGLFSLSG
jgi:hypothetical protein